MTLFNWRDITYLQQGTPRQRAAFIAIRDLQLLLTLKDYDPILVGTIPIGVDVSQSDLDFACYAPNLRKFETVLSQNFSNRDSFATNRKTVRDRETIIGRFSYNQFTFEIFGQDCPTEKQDSYRHMVVEQRILALSNEHTRLKIKRLRNSGKKTESAFAEILGIQGNPYDALLKIADEDDQTLVARLKHAGLI